MTICIAAIAKEKEEEFLIFATDHMVSTPIGQFEHSIVKYRELNKTTVAMLAGHALLFDDLIGSIKEDSSFSDAKKQIFENFKKKRKDVIEKEIFNIFGINEKLFLDALQKQIPNPYIQTILQKVAEFKLNTSILLVGFEKGIAKIAEVTEEGHLDFRSMNFHAIGSGSIQASNTLLFQKHSKKDSLNSTIYNVYKAKRNAEATQGVGKETELLILSEKGLKTLSDIDLDILKNIYEEELKYGKCHQTLKNLKM